MKKAAAPSSGPKAADAAKRLGMSFPALFASHKISLDMAKELVI